MKKRIYNLSYKQEARIREEVEIFKAEYPDYTDEHITAYLELCDDYSREEKDLFCRLLGY